MPLQQTAQMKTLLDIFAREELVAVVRTVDAESALWAAEQVIRAGFRLVEVTMTVPEASGVIEALTERHPNVVIGAGTVLEAKDAVRALAAGARFLVAPVVVEPLIQLGLEQDILVLPGGMTPTEIYRAWGLGAPAVKLFPAGPAGGPELLKAIKAPLPDIPIVPTGGIDLAQVSAYLQAGALAVGIGGPLFPAPLLRDRNAEGLRQHAARYLQNRGGERPDGTAS